MPEIQITENDVSEFGERLTGWAAQQSPKDRLILASLLDLAMREAGDVAGHGFEVGVVSTGPSINTTGQTPQTTVSGGFQTIPLDQVIGLSNSTFNTMSGLVQQFATVRNQLISGL